MPKRIVISGYYGFKNFGDEAILSVLVNKLKQDKHLISVISSDPKYTKRLYKHIRSYKTFDMPNIIGAILKSDILISGGGSLLQDVTSFKSLVYYLLIIFIALLFQKKVIIFAQGIGPINNIAGKFFTKVLLKHCSYVSVRDKKSHQLLKSWGINSDLLSDPIFSIKIDNIIKSNTVGVQLRDYRGMNQDFIDRLAKSVSDNFSDKSIEIYSFQDEIDTKICKDFEKNLKMLNPDIQTKVYTGLTNDEITENVSRCEYLIAMRFHAIIIGLISKSKILAINYDIKVEKLANEFHLPIIDTKHEFKTQFKDLKTQNPELHTSAIKNKQFNWDGFTKAIFD